MFQVRLGALKVEWRREEERSRVEREGEERESAEREEERVSEEREEEERVSEESGTVVAESSMEDIGAEGSEGMTDNGVLGRDS